MNYIREINAFYLRQIEYQLRATEQALWHRLMAYCNALGWKEEFTVPTQVLMHDLKISRNELNRIRAVLVDCGLINYTQRQGCKSGIYRMIPFVDRDECNHSSFDGSFDEAFDGAQTAASTLLYKQNETKKNEIRKKERKRTSFAEVIASFSFDSEVEEEIGNFIQMRTLSKKPLTDNALKLILTKLLDYQKNDQLAMLRASVINCWADVYPPKGKEALKEPEKLDYSTDGW